MRNIEEMNIKINFSSQSRGIVATIQDASQASPSPPGMQLAGGKDAQEGLRFDAPPPVELASYGFEGNLAPPPANKTQLNSELSDSSNMYPAPPGFDTERTKGVESDLGPPVIAEKSPAATKPKGRSPARKK